MGDSFEQRLVRKDLVCRFIWKIQFIQKHEKVIKKIYECYTWVFSGRSLQNETLLDIESTMIPQL